MSLAKKKVAPAADYKKAEVFGNITLTDKKGKVHRFPKGVALTSDQGDFVAWVIAQAKSNPDFTLSNLSMSFQVVDQKESFVAPDL